MNDQQKTIELKRLATEVGESFPKEVIEQIDEFADVGEWGVGLEELCIQVSEFELPIDKDFYLRIHRLGTAMNMPPSTWNDLQRFVRE